MIQFQTDPSLAPTDETLRLISSPLNSYLLGEQQGRLQDLQDLSLQDAQEVLRQRRLEGIGKEYDAQLAQAKMTDSDYIPALLGGTKGTFQTQQMSGQEAVRKAKLLEPFYQAQKIALDPNSTPEQQALAQQQLQTMAGVLATNPENVAKLEQIALKASQSGSNKAPTYADIQRAMTYASQVGMPVKDALDLLQQGKLHMLGVTDQTLQQPQQPVAPIGKILTEGAARQSMVSPNEPLNMTPRNMEYDLAAIDRAIADKNTTPDAKAELQRYREQVVAGKKGVGMDNAPLDTTLPANTGDLLTQKFLKQSSNATVQERSANLANNFLQTANDVRNFLESPELSTMGIFSGLAGKDKDSILSSLSAFVGRKLTSEEDRALQQAMSGFKVTMANVIGGGFATASSKARMDALADQIPREGDSPSAKITWLARVKQELEAAAETFETRQGATDQQKQLVKKAMGEIEKSIPWSMSDVNAALRQKTGQKPTSESSAIPNRYKAGDTKTINGTTYIRTEQGWVKQ